MIISVAARVWLVIVSCALLVPVAAIRMQDTASLERFHNRSLSPWPSAHSLLLHPEQYFASAKLWLADRVYPIIDASIFQNRFLWHVLDTPPQRRISVGADGFVFLNGASERHLNNILEFVCVRAHSQAVSSRFQNSLLALASFAQARNLPVDVIVVPTLETLYGDRLPPSVPAKYRAACGERAAGISPLAAIRAPASVHYIFPFAQMHAARGDGALFPKGNWHPDGLSLKVVRDAYLSSLGDHGTIDEKIRLTTGPSELFLSYGIDIELPVYRISNPKVVIDAETSAAVKASVSDIFTGSLFGVHAFYDSEAPDQATLLLLSDSYGDLAAPVFAGGFRRLIHVTTNDLRQHEIVALLRRIAHVVHFDRMALLVEEGNTDRVVGYAQDLRDSLSASAEK